MQTMMGCIRHLKGGNTLVVFPEGTRNKTHTVELQPLKDGAGVFATKAKVKILPLMFTGKVSLFRKKTLLIGKPFEISEFYETKITEDERKRMDGILYEKMTETLQEWNS